MCTNYIDSFLLKLKILNQVPIVHINGFYGMLFDYIL
jgi:hypothetical protein